MTLGMVGGFLRYGGRVFENGLRYGGRVLRYGGRVLLTQFRV